jgi:hypothetical protein
MARLRTSEEREYQRVYQIDRYRRWMTEAREMLGGQCVVCGTTEDLEFDHISPATKLFALTDYRPGKTAWLAEAVKCQLLCKTHHREKTAREQQTSEHGTWGMWRRCKCQTCRKFVNGYMREYKRRKRQAAASALRAAATAPSLL